MSKHKTKRARREAKREESRKVAAHHRRAAVAASKPKSTGATTRNAPNSNMNPKPSSKSTPNSAAPMRPPVQASQKHEVPFGAYDRILLVGEGDFSFTKSLVMDHGCANVTATSYDNEEEVRRKYPTFEGVHEELTELTPPVPFHYGINATRISTYKALRKGADSEEQWEGWDKIAFMFPHTGGLSTDVNRQVRANQALLVEFFKSCLEIQDQKSKLNVLQKQKAKGGKQKHSTEFLKMGGKIIVTLFEGEPYTLWNIRDLARHAGLKVVESWKLDWEQYPAYKHVRTLGAIEGGSAWRGEEREARMFVFEKVPLEPDTDEERELAKQREKKGNKRAREESESDSDG